MKLFVVCVEHHVAILAEVGEEAYAKSLALTAIDAPHIDAGSVAYVYEVPSPEYLDGNMAKMAGRVPYGGDVTCLEWVTKRGQQE